MYTLYVTMEGRKFLFAAALFLLKLNLPRVEGLLCYECIMPPDENCEQSPETVTECANSNCFTSAIILPPSNDTTIARGCIMEGIEESGAFAEVLEAFVICHEDKCNSGPAPETAVTIPPIEEIPLLSTRDASSAPATTTIGPLLVLLVALTLALGLD